MTCAGGVASEEDQRLAHSPGAQKERELSMIIL